MHASAAEQHRCERDEEGNKITIRSTEWPDFLDGLLQVEQKFTAGDGGALIYRYKEQSQATKDYHQAFCAELGMDPAQGDVTLSGAAAAFHCSRDSRARTHDISPGAMTSTEPTDPNGLANDELGTDYVFAYASNGTARVGVNLYSTGSVRFQSF